MGSRFHPEVFTPGYNRTKEQDDRYWRTHPIELSTMPELPLNDLTADINEIREELLRLEQRTPAGKQEVYELKHLVNKLMERLNRFDKKQGGGY